MTDQHAGMGESGADAILRRLLDAVERAWDEDSEHMKNTDLDAWLACRDARAYLFREKGPVADMWVEFINLEMADGSTLWCAVERRQCDPFTVKVRISVPAHIVSPPVCDGEVVEGKP